MTEKIQPEAGSEIKGNAQESQQGSQAERVHSARKIEREITVFVLRRMADGQFVPFRSYKALAKITPKQVKVKSIFPPDKVFDRATGHFLGKVKWLSHYRHRIDPKEVQ